MDVNALPLETRNSNLQMLSDFYSGGEGQNAFIEDTKSNPFYGQMVAAGQEGVLANAGARGLTRSGNTAEDLSLSNQNVLNSLVNQRLQGIGGLAGQNINTSGVANQYNQMGQNVGAAGMGIVNAEQQQAGNLLGGIGSFFGI